LELENTCNEDFYYETTGRVVFTEKYHIKRGYCCNSGCRHCPFESKTEEEENSPQLKSKGIQ